MGIIILPGQGDREGDDFEEFKPAGPYSDASTKAWAANALADLIAMRLEDHERPAMSAVIMAIGELVGVGDPRLAVAVLLAVRVKLQGGDDALSDLLHAMSWAIEAEGTALRRCRVCGCSNVDACAGGCWWVDWDLCSTCQGHSEAAEGDTHG